MFKMRQFTNFRKTSAHAEFGGSNRYRKVGRGHVYHRAASTIFISSSWCLEAEEGVVWIWGKECCPHLVCERSCCRGSLSVQSLQKVLCGGEHMSLFSELWYKDGSCISWSCSQRALVYGVVQQVTYSDVHDRMMPVFNYAHRFLQFPGIVWGYIALVFFHFSFVVLYQL